MISIDTNILFKSIQVGTPQHEEARRFIAGMARRRDVGISEFVLTELYGLLRNKVVIKPPYDAEDATAAIGNYRHHPFWALLGYPRDSRSIHDQLWEIAGRNQFARRRIYDTRLALTLRAFGVTEFATTNVRDFQGLGFHRVWNPLEET